MSDNHDLLNDNDMCSFPEHEAEDMCFNCGNHTYRSYSVYTKNKRQKRLSIKVINVLYSFMDYKRLGLNSHYEKEELNGYSEAFIDLDKVPIIINGTKL